MKEGRCGRRKEGKKERRGKRVNSRELQEFKCIEKELNIAQIFSTTDSHRPESKIYLSRLVLIK